MIGLLGRTAAAAALGSVAGAAWLLLFYAIDPAVRMEFAVTPPPQVTGIYAAERDPASGLTFAWTADVLTIRLPGIDRQTAWQLEMRARAARPDPATNPELAIYVDGAHVLTTPASSDFADIQVPVPPRPERPGLTIAVRSSATMVPGPHDPRKLGVMLDRVSFSPDAFVVPPRRALAGVAGATAIAGVALVLLGAGTAPAIGGAMLVGAGLALIVTRGLGPYTDYPDVLVRLSFWTWLCAVAFAAGARLTRRQALTGSATFVAAVSAVAAVMKLGVLLHPEMPIGDALFHAHRFHYVLAGKFHFTSLAPGNYAFPYAPGLYVAAAPLADLVQRGAGDMALLRIFVISADAVAAALLYWAVVRSTGARVAAACAVVLYHLVPLDFLVATVGNLTNAFGQSLAVGALALMATPPFRTRLYAFSALLSVVLASAFMSHTSTFAIGTAGTLAIAVLFYWRGDAPLRRDAMAIAVALAAAALAATVLYYAHFMETYRAEWARISVETATGAADAGGRGIVGRLLAAPRYFHIFLGAPFLALAAWGLMSVHREPGARRLALALDGWLLGCLLFLVVGILTPMDMRHYLAAIPALAVAAGFGVVEAWKGGALPRAAAATLLAWSVWRGLDTWWSTIQ